MLGDWRALGRGWLCGLLMVGCAVSDTDGEGGRGGSGGADSTTQTGSGTTQTGSGGQGVGGAGSSASSSSASSSSTQSGSTQSSSSTGSGSVCGNGLIESGETCEGGDFGGKICEDYGFAGGSLVCNSFCNIVVSNCTPVEQCNDGQDNDFDSLVDCADPDCAGALACTDPCGAAQLLTLPGWGSGDITGEPDVLQSSCGGPGGNEAVFEVTAFADGDLTASLYSDFDGVISLRSDCDDPLTELVCRNNMGGNQSENVSISAVAGQKVYIVVEAFGPVPFGFYSISVDQPQPEAWCDDGWDDDFDGYLDCDDPTNCKGISPECVAGPGAYATNCFSNTECQATGGDPICLGFQQGFQNGYCSEFCSGPGDCGPGGACIDLNISVSGVCFKTCATSAECPSGTECVDGGGGQLICDKPPEINCQDNQDNDSDGLQDCEDPSSCKGLSPSCTPGPGAVGTGCQLHSQCQATDGDPQCLDQFWWGLPGGYCTEFCDFQPGSCPSGSQCSNWFFFQSGNGLCFDNCASQADCRPGYSCTDIGLPQMVCLF